MVKNTTGGTKTKGLARKHVRNAGGNGRIRLPEDVLEQFACVDTMLGNGMCRVSLDTGETLMGHIPGKFRGKNKRHNLIAINTILLVGLREWESDKENCDVMTVYNDSEVKQLKEHPTIKISNVLSKQLQNASFGQKESTEDDIVDFCDKEVEEEEDDELKDLVSKKVLKNIEQFKTEQNDEIDVDDI